MKSRLARLGVTCTAGALALTLGVACSAASPVGLPPDSEGESFDGALLQEPPAVLPEERPAPAEIPVAESHPVTAPYSPQRDAGDTLSAPPPRDTGKAIVVDQTLQVMAVFEDGVEIRRMPISTGRPTYTTYTLPWNGYVGDYWGTILAETGGRADNAWFLYRARGAILIHGAPYHEVNGVKQYYDLEALGRYPSSEGCIRLLPDDAVWFTEWGPLNAAIRVTEWPGEIAGLIGDPLPYP